MPGCKVGDLAIILPHPLLMERNPEAVGAIVRVHGISSNRGSPIADWTYWKITTAHKILKVVKGDGVSYYDNKAQGVPDIVLQPIRPSLKAIETQMLKSLEARLDQAIKKFPIYKWI